MPTSNEINIDGEYYWVMCPSESDKPLIAEQTDYCWYLTGSEKAFSKAMFPLTVVECETACFH